MISFYLDYRFFLILINGYKITVLALSDSLSCFKLFRQKSFLNIPSIHSQLSKVFCNKVAILFAASVARTPSFGTLKVIFVILLLNIVFLMDTESARFPVGSDSAPVISVKEPSITKEKHQKISSNEIWKNPSQPGIVLKKERVPMSFTKGSRNPVERNSIKTPNYIKITVTEDLNLNPSKVVSFLSRNEGKKNSEKITVSEDKKKVKIHKM
ncbi:expressed protein, partial [Phakopsora pachyrhizi]